MLGVSLATITESRWHNIEEEGSKGRDSELAIPDYFSQVWKGLGGLSYKLTTYVPRNETRKMEDWHGCLRVLSEKG